MIEDITFTGLMPVKLQLPIHPNSGPLLKKPVLDYILKPIDNVGFGTVDAGVTVSDL